MGNFCQLFFDSCCCRILFTWSVFNDWERRYYFNRNLFTGTQHFFEIFIGQRSVSSSINDVTVHNFVIKMANYVQHLFMPLVILIKSTVFMPFSHLMRVMLEHFNTFQYILRLSYRFFHKMLSQFSHSVRTMPIHWPSWIFNKRID